MDKKQKCIWTGEVDSRVKAIRLKTLDRFSIPSEKTFNVLPDYEQELRDFNGKFIEYGRLFLVLIIVLPLILPVIVFTFWFLSLSEYAILISAGAITSLIGAIIIIFPFATPETVEWLGLKRAIKIIRIAGFLTVLLGVVICILPFLMSM